MEGDLYVYVTELAFQIFNVMKGGADSNLFFGFGFDPIPETLQMYPLQGTTTYIWETYWVHLHIDMSGSKVESLMLRQNLQVLSSSMSWGS